jgi:hypothetical protein
MNRTTSTTVAVIAGAIAAAVLSAPSAAAQPTCHEAGSLVRCETNGSVSIKTVPGTRAPNVADQIPRDNNRSGIILTW